MTTTKKLSDLPAAAPILGTETVFGLQSGVSVQIPYGSFKNITTNLVSNIANSTWSGGTDFIKLNAVSGSAYSEQSISFQEAGSDIGAKIGVKNKANGAYDIIFVNRDNSSITSALTEKLRITATGNVGIGTSEPSTKLTVAGSLTITGAFALRGSYGAGAITSNFAAGDGALNSNTTGSSNTASGLQALLSNTTGSYNTASGLNALLSNTTGIQNTAIGVGALYDLGTTTIAATALVNGTAYQIVTMGTTTAAQWIASGAVTGTIGEIFTANAVAGVGTGTVATSANVATQSLSNTALGYNTGRGITTGSGNTILGANVTGLAAGLTNTIILADGTGVVRQTIDSSGNVGIGTSSPQNTLHVIVGLANTTGDSLTTAAAQITGPNVAGNGVSNATFLVATNDALGIDIGGSIGFAGRYSGTAQFTAAQIRGAKETATAGEFGGYLAFGTRANGTHITEKMRISGAGNVGIGNTPSGTYKLEVTGNIKATGSLIIGSSGVYEAGSIYSDANYGMIFRAKQSSPATGYEFLWTKADGTWVFGHNGTALTTNVTGSSGSCTGNSNTATTATNQSGGTVSATTGTFSGDVYASAGQFKTNRANAAGVTTSGLVLQIDGGIHAQIVTPASGTMAMYTAGIERMRIDSSGNVSLQKNISVGAAAPTTSGVGITFPTPNVVSTNANTLDDYEEGIWTPVLTSGFTTTGTVTNRSGVFTKIGRSVTVSWIVQASTVSPANGAVMSGLPFAASHYGVGLAQSAGGTGVSMATSLSGSNLVFGGTSIAPANLLGSVTYITAA